MDKFSDISYKYIKYNKKRSLTIIFAIMISVFLIFGIGTLGLSIYNDFLGQATAKGDYVVVFDKVSNEDYKLLKEHVNIDKICAIDDSLKVTLPQKKSEDRTLEISVYKDLNQEVFSYSIDEGDYPKVSDEIMIEDVSRYFLDKKYNIGDKITLNAGENERTYKIVGFFSKADSSNRNSIFSAVTIKDNASLNDSWKVYASFKSHVNIKASAEKISNDFGISLLKYNNEILALYGQTTGSSNNLILILVACFILIFVSELIIRNTIHMSVVERTKDFGILRCLGISQRKLKKILYKESLTLGIIAVFVGITLCFGILKVFELVISKNFNIGEYFEVELYGFIVILSVVLVFAAIIFSLFEPGRILKKISPLEAVRSNFAIKKEEIKRRKKGGIIFRKIFGVEGEYAYKNIMRNRGKFISVLIAFTISISIFIAFNGTLKTLIESGGNNENNQNNYSGYYDAIIYMEGGFEEKVSMETSLNEIRNIDGVVEAKESFEDALSYFDEKYTITEEYKNSLTEDESSIRRLSNSWIVGYDREELQLLKKNIIEGDFEVDNLKMDEVILCNYDNLKTVDDKSKKIKVYDINVGDEIAIIDYSKYKERTTEIGDKKIGKALYDEGLYKKVRVVAIVDKDPIYDITPDIIFSKEGFRKVVPENLDTKRTINLKLKECEISEELNNYINNNPQYQFINYLNDSMAYIKEMENIKLYVNIIITVIGVICALNIMNTIATNQVLRKKEFATLRTIGMSKKKLCKMIALEGILASIIASILGCIIGNIMGYNLLLLGATVEVDYKIPYMAMILGVIVVIAIALLSSIVSIIKIGNQNIVEGIKDNE